MTAPKGYEGLLEVHGTLDIAQCWPTGESDADTSHVVVDANGFTFRPKMGEPIKATHVFDGAQVRGTGAVSEYLRHYHAQRNHRGLGNELIAGAPTTANTNGRVARRKRLGGLLNFYHREAA